ncbi:hypothetical protein ACWDRR_17765 [Kitasatospora sp. NPDC003701]
MTDKLPRRSGGDGDGPDDTPMERLLREAMSARAMQITAHDLRPAAPPSRRMRRLKPVHLAAVPLFGLAAAMAFGVLGFRGDTVAKQEDPGPAATVTATVSPSASPTAEPTPSESPSATAATTTPAADPVTEAPVGVPSTTGTPTTATTTTPPAAPSTPYTFRGVKLKIPAGWRAAPAADAASSDRLCVLSPGAPQNATSRDCDPYGVTLNVFDVEAESWPSVYFMDSPGGWSSQPNCPVWDNPHIPTDSERLTSTGPVKTTPTVSGRPARKSQWQVTCNPKESFTAQMWALPKDQVFVSAIGLKSDYQAGLQAIVNSLDVSGHPAPYSGDVTVSTTGLSAGQAVPNDGTPVEFSVTFKNTGRTTYSGAKVYFYPGLYTTAEEFPKGTLERLDGANWKPLDFWLPSDPDTVPVLPLAPGQSATVKYRLKIAATEKPDTFPLSIRYARPVPDTGSYAVPGEVVIPLKVVAK